MRFPISKYTTFLFLFLSMGVLSLVLPTPVLSGVCGALGLLGLFFFLGVGISQRFFSQIPWAPLWGTVLGVCLFFLGHTISYVLFGITPMTIGISMVLLAGGALLLHKGVPFPSFSIPHMLLHVQDILGLVVLGLQGLMFFALSTKSTTIALGSPWLVIGPRFFVVYAITTCLLLCYVYFTKPSWLKHVVIGIHFLTTLSVAAFVYQLGFGYDPFLHRAAEKDILAHGVILPRTPFYIGQYVLITILVLVGHIPLFFADAWLVMMLTSLFLPLCVFYVLRYHFSFEKNLSHVGSVCILLVSFIAFFVTTPHNFATLLTLLTFMLGLVCFSYRKFFPIVVGVSLFAFAVHPLSGMFAVLFVIGIALWLYKDRFPKPIYKGTWVALCAGSLVVMPFLFFSYLLLKGVSLPSPMIIFSRLSVFADVFGRPYYYHNSPSASFLLDTLYSYQMLIPVVLVFLGLYGWYRTFRKTTWLTVLMFIFLLSNVFFLSTWVVISDLNTFEQVQYAQRLRHMLLFPLLLFSLYSVLLFFSWLRKKHVFFQLLFLGIMSVCITGSFYLTYPQQNKKTHFPGYNVTSADIEAARYIEADTADGASHVVLSNLLTAAASIDQFGFSRYYDTDKGLLFYYAIPSGSPLAEAYRNLVYVAQDKQYIDDVFALTGVDRVYFVISSFWSGYADIVAGMSKHADEIQVINNGAITIFRYDR
ncbi:MAG: hypothetical protein GW939_01610 [Candidatus Magasanikbacteria bacterium]|nr:hypothetical protein [Candidatus Magasanikbacteria bacterium]